MTYRWMVSEDGGATFARQVTPSGVTNPLFEWSKENGSARAGKRLKLASSLTFSAKDDYQYLKGRKDATGECEPIPIRFELKCSGVWEVLWTGRFAAGGGRWDLRKCLFTIKPQADDRFTCILERQDIKTNLMNAGVVTVRVATIPSLEFGTCTTIGTTPTPIDACEEFYGVPGSVLGPLVNGWDNATTSQAAPGPSQVNFYWREYTSTECVDDTPVPPIGSGWELITDNCSTDGTAVYARQPVISWPFDEPTPGTVVDGVNIPPDDTCSWVFMGMGGVEDPFDPETTHPLPYYVCVQSAETQDLTRGRTLESCLELLVDRMGCGIAGIRSDFFGINPVGDAPGYVAGLNYVTGQATQTEGLVLFQKTDVIDPDAAQPAIRGEMTFKEMMVLLGLLYQVLWDIDDEGYLRIEHYVYWNSQLGLDLTTTNEVVESLIYDALNDEVPNVERATFEEAQGSDFIGKGIVYSGPCVTAIGESGEIEYTAKAVTTDVNMILSDPTSVSRKGFVLIACTYNGSEYDAIIDQGAITGDFIANAPLSWANLQRDFWTWNRYLPTGNMNGQDVTFDGFRPTKEQEEITVKCHGCGVLQFSADQLVRSTLGDQHFGVDGTVEKATFDTSGNLRMSLRYSV